MNFFGVNKKEQYDFEKDGFFATENFGFNKFFIIKPLPLNLDVNLDGVDGSKSANQLSKAFSQSARGRLQNRAVLGVLAKSSAHAA